MDSAVCDFIDRAPFVKQSLIQFAEMFPADDGELDAWIAAQIRGRETLRVGWLVITAMHAGRPVDARHLAEGLNLLHSSWIGLVVTRASGEFIQPVLAAVRDTPMTGIARANALLAAAMRQVDEGGSLVAPSLIAEARSLARNEHVPSEGVSLLQAMAHVSQDAALGALLERRLGRPACQGELLPLVARMVEAARTAWHQEPLDFLPEALPRGGVIAAGTTMRRAVQRISRNDPCPCGSGRKYKRCCFEKDQQRLRESSDIAGKTGAEVRAELEAHLTLARLGKLEPNALARLDPDKMPRELVPRWLLLLAVFSLFDRAIEILGQFAPGDDLRPCIDELLWRATIKGRRDILQRLVPLHPDAAHIDDHIHISTALLLATDDTEKTFRFLDEHSRLALEENDDRGMTGFAYGLLLVPRFRLLGIFVARSMIPLLPRKDAVFLLDHILEARDQLNLRPDDPYGDILDQRFAEALAADPGPDADALRAARRELERKTAEARRAREELDRVRRELSRREVPPPSPSAHAAPPPSLSPDEEARLRELRGKVQTLKTELKDRHAERATLRRQLQQAHIDLEKLREHPSVREHPAAPADDEERHLLPGDEPGSHQPPRVIEFPRKFTDTLASLPRPVARAALAMLGRLAGGEPAAFVGVVRLKECPDTLRQRIGIDHRLLFRLHGDRLEVIDLINRRDLERRIKTLVRGT